MGTALAIEVIKYPSAPQAVPLEQNHGSWGSSDRQTGTAAAAAGADHSATGVGAHAHAETGHALALAAGSFKGALGHGGGR